MPPMLTLPEVEDYVKPKKSSFYRMIARRVPGDAGMDVAKAAALPG